MGSLQIPTFKNSTCTLIDHPTTLCLFSYGNGLKNQLSNVYQFIQFFPRRYIINFLFTHKGCSSLRVNRLRKFSTERRIRHYHSQQKKITKSQKCSIFVKQLMFLSKIVDWNSMVVFVMLCSSLRTFYSLITSFSALSRL